MPRRRRCGSSVARDVDAADAPDDASWATARLRRRRDARRHLVRLSAPDDADDYARVLYASLREADALGLTTVLAVAPPPDGIGAAVVDRLTRAAARA